MRWPALFLLLLAAALSGNLLLHHCPTSLAAFLSRSGRNWKWLTGILGGGERRGGNRRLSFGPNISACHPSFSDANAPVFCCPPVPDASQQVVDFQLPDISAAPMRLRRPAHLVDEGEYLEKYRRAVAIMKALPPTHPHSWTRQANMHCLYCTGAYDQLQSNHVFKIHRSWYFFPWHRAFTFFHERILGKLIGDDSFALPYWQWDHPDGMHIPAIFLNGSLNHRDRDAIHLPPAVTDDSYKKFEKGLPAEVQVAENLAFMYTQMVSGAKSPELFMGCKLHPGKEDMCNGPGTIESSPHNSLHAWVGAGYNPEREDMGAFYAAARDPIFYSHHANIDRLWMLWRELHGGRQEITDELWLNTHFYFHDENLVLTRVKVRDFLDVSKLGYRYEDADLPWLSARPLPAVDPSIARRILHRKRSANLPLRSSYLGRALNETVTIEVPRHRQRRAHRNLTTAAAAEAAAVVEEEVLVVYGIETKKDVYTTFDVYVNVADEAKVLELGPRAREFAGTFVAMRKGVKVVRRREFSDDDVKTELKLGISELLEDLEAEEEDSIWVTLVPRGETGTNVVVGGVRVEYLAW